MSTTTDSALDALAALHDAMRAREQTLERSDRMSRRATSGFLDETSGIAETTARRWLGDRGIEDEDLRSHDALEILDKLTDDLETYFASGEEANLERFDIKSRRVVATHREQRWTEMEEATHLARDANSRLVVPTRNAQAALRAWREDLRTAPDASDRCKSEWPTVVQAWLRATGLTMREAAERVGVAPATIARYSKGSRTPDPTQLSDLVDRVIDAGLRPREDDLTVAALHLHQVGFGNFQELLDRATEEQVELLEQLGRAAEHLNGDSLRILIALARSPAAIEAVQRTAAYHAQRSGEHIHDALLSAGVDITGNE